MPLVAANGRSRKTRGQSHSSGLRQIGRQTLIRRLINPVERHLVFRRRGPLDSLRPIRTSPSRSLIPAARWAAISLSHGSARDRRRGLITSPGRKQRASSAECRVKRWLTFSSQWRRQDGRRNEFIQTVDTFRRLLATRNQKIVFGKICFKK